MNSRSRIVIVMSVFALVVAGCASTKVTNRQMYEGGKLARPNNIWVYDFVATPDGVPADSALAGQYAEPDKPMTPEEIAAGRKLGAQIAQELVTEIQAMGLFAQEASTGMKPQVNDIVIRGYLVSIGKGSAAERLVIGFGAGKSELTTLVEGYQMTADGLRKLGSGTVESGGSKTPGSALGVVGLIATGNPAGLIISTGMKVYGEASGSSKLEGRAKATAKEIAEKLKPRFQQEGWID